MIFDRSMEEICIDLLREQARHLTILKSLPGVKITKASTIPKPARGVRPSRTRRSA